MNQSSRALALVCLVAALAATPTQAAPILTITDGPGGTLNVAYTGGPPAEDDIFTVVNNSSQIIQQLDVQGSTLFSFDGDGPFGGGYNGPNESTTVLTNSHGLVNFTGPTSFGIPGLAPGTSGQFGVDNEDGNPSVTASVTQAVSTPEPATMALFGLCAAGAGVYGWRRRKPVAA